MRTATNSANETGVSAASIPPLSDHLRLDERGSLGFNEACPHVWTGTHQFTRPLLFSVDQAVPTSTLSCEGESHGDLLGFVKGKGWSRVAPSPVAGRALVWTAGAPAWGLIDLSAAVQGTLPKDKGGTGVSEWEEGALFVGGKALPAGSPGEVLTVGDGGSVAWRRSTGLTGRGDPYALAVWTEEGGLTSFPVEVTRAGHLCLGGAILFETSESGIEAKKESLVISFSETHLVVSENAISVRGDNGDPWLCFSADEGMEVGAVPVARLKGVLPVENGGTGLPRLRRGDLLYAGGETEWARLSVPDSGEGLVLSLVDGLPAWASPSNSVSRPRTTLKLIAGDANRPPLLFTRGTLTSAPQEGSLEWGEGGLYFTDEGSARRRLLFQGEDVQGTARMVREVVPLALGGLGQDVTKLPDDALLVKRDGGIGGIGSGKVGASLCVLDNGLGWRETVHSVSVLPKGGLLLDGGADAPRLRLDFALDGDWTGKHRFRNAVQMEDGAFVGALVMRTLAAPPDPKSGLVWFDGRTLWLWANGRWQSLTGGGNEATPVKESHLLRLCAAVPAGEARHLRRLRVPLPYAASDGITPRQWKLKRLTARVDDATVGLRMNLLVGGELALEPALSLPYSGAESATAETCEFTHAVFRSGEEVWVECAAGEGGDTGYLSAWLLIEAL